jgi:two-component system, NarL family, sensor kinase
MTWFRRLLPWFFAASVAVNCFELATLTVLHWNGATGMSLVPAGEPFQRRAEAVSDPASAAGFRVGDRVDVLEVRRANGFANPVPGIPFQLIAHRDARTTAVAIVPVQSALNPSQVVRVVAVFWLIGFALLVAIRGEPSRPNALLLTILVALAMVSPLDRMVFPDSRLTFVATWLMSPILWYAACIPLVLYAQCFGQPVSAWRRLLALCVYASIAVDLVQSVLFGSETLLYPWPGLSNRFADVVVVFSWDSLLLALLCLVAAIPAARPDERQRLGWVIAAFTPYLAGVVLGNFSSETSVWRAVQNASFFFIPAALTYAALAKRMFDVGFAVNRATVFAGVSVVVVGAFVLVEWALGKLFENVSHATSLALNAGLALILGLSIRFLHKKIDLAVDNVFFRKRHENEAALRRFAREAGFFTDAEKLVERARTTILSHSEATAEVVTAAEIDPNDAAIVALQAWHEPIDLIDYDTALQGELAFPMLAHGTLVGAVVCGPKLTGERYAPDEIEALRELAHGVGLAIDSVARDAGNGAAFAQISKMFAEISARLDGLGQTYFVE